MTGPRRRPPHPTHGLTVASWPPREHTPPVEPPTPPRPPARPTVTTVRRRPRNADAASRQRIDRPRPAGFAQIPAEVALDPDLLDIDVRVYWWFCSQRELWNGARGSLRVKDAAAELARTVRTIKPAIARLEARGHIIVTRSPGRPSTYSVPWLNVHKLGRRMAVVGE